jgi:ABC-type multidrug transport system fused ATPase/permease subunit
MQALLLAPLLVIIDVICEIVHPELISKIVHSRISQKNLDYILHIGGIMVLLSLVAIAANIGNIYFSSQASVGFSAELRKGLFNKLQQFSFSNLDKFSSASLVTRITNDVDEATSSIDRRSEEIIQKGMDQLMQGRTSFVIAHRLSTVRNADEIMVLENGEIIERGNHETLLKLKGRYFEV